MKILLIHKFHYMLGGTETFHYNLAEALTAAGHEVIFFSMYDERNIPCAQDKYFVSNIDYNDPNLSTFKKIKMGIKLIYSFESKHNIEKLIRDEKPDIAHIGLLHRQITFSVVDVLKKYNIPVVMHLHELTAVCPCYTMLRQDGTICSDCATKGYWNCVKNKCMKGSLAKSVLAYTEAQFLRYGHYYAYMAYQTYTNSQASGYKYLWGSDSSTSNGGLRKYKDFICMALGSYYGPDGTFVKIEFDDGKVIYAVKGDEKKDSETDSRHMYHTGSDANMTEFIIDGNVVIGNEKFTSALEAEGINRSARVVRIWTSDTEPTYGSTGSTSGEKEYHFADTNEKIPIHNSIFKQAPMLLDGALKVVVNDTDVSKHIGDISWTNTKNTLATTMSFSTPKPKEMKYMNIYIPKMGDIMRYSGGDKEDFRGVIIEVDDGAMYENKYTAVDVGWYLNKTTDTYQFTSMRADDCIKKICNDLYIPIVLIPELSTLITQIYIDKPVSDVIKDILDKCGNGYNFDFVPDGMRIYLCSDKVVEPKFRISPNTELKNSVQYMGNIEHKGSIENMKNSVKVITDTDVMTTLKAEESISKYGFLQEVVKMNDGDNASDLAKKNLGELNKEDETYSGEIIEELTSYTRAGSTIEKDGVKYVITSSQHSIKNGVHYNKIDMERLV